MSNCVCCYSPINAHSSDNSSIPQHGDVSICAYCGHISVFDEKLKLTTAPQSVIDSIDPQYLEIAQRLSTKFTSTQTKRKYEH